MSGYIRVWWFLEGQSLLLVQIYFSALCICHVQTKYRSYCHEPILLCLSVLLALCILQPGALNNQLQNVLLCRGSQKLKIRDSVQLYAVLHRFDALKNSNSFCFLLLFLLCMFSFNPVFSQDFRLYCTYINFILSWT